jgi:hypothetical protein
MLALGAAGYRAVQILGGLLFVVLSLLLYLGVIS